MGWQQKAEKTDQETKIQKIRPANEIEISENLKVCSLNKSMSSICWI